MNTVKGELFKSYVLDCFKNAAAAFAAKPDANEWVDLRIAMWAWQHVSQMKPEQATDAAHDHLEAIAAFAKGDSNFSEP